MSEKLLPQSDVTVTPTLTNAQKYTSEFGFTPGVVVDFIYAPLRCSVVGFFISFDGQHLIISNVAGRDKYYSPGIEQIRILSGPFRVWAELVPDWAATHHQFMGSERQASQSWWGGLDELTLEAATQLGEHGFIKNPSYIITRRPWWVSEGQK